MKTKDNPSQVFGHSFVALTCHSQATRRVDPRWVVVAALVAGVFVKKVLVVVKAFRLLYASVSDFVLPVEVDLMYSSPCNVVLFVFVKVVSMHCLLGLIQTTQSLPSRPNRVYCRARLRTPRGCLDWRERTPFQRVNDLRILRH